MNYGKQVTISDWNYNKHCENDNYNSFINFKLLRNLGFLYWR